MSGSRRLRWAAAASVAAGLAIAPAFTAPAADAAPAHEEPSTAPGIITVHLRGGETVLVDAGVLVSLGGFNLVRLAALLDLGSETSPLALDIDLWLLESRGLMAPQAPGAPPPAPAPSAESRGAPPTPWPVTMPSTTSSTSTSSTSSTSTSSTTSTTIELPAGAQSAPIQIATNKRGVTVRAIVTPSELGRDDGVATVTFVVHNGSDEEVTDLRLRNLVTAGGSASSAHSTHGRCAVVGSEVDCALGALAPGEQATITAEVSLAPTDGSLLVQQASITGTGLGGPLKLTLSTSVGDPAGQEAGLQVLGFPGPIVTTLGLISFVFAASMSGETRRVLNGGQRRS